MDLPACLSDVIPHVPLARCALAPSRLIFTQAKHILALSTNYLKFLKGKQEPVVLKY